MLTYHDYRELMPMIELVVPTGLPNDLRPLIRPRWNI